MNKTDLDRIMQSYPVLKDLPPDILKKLQEQAALLRAPAGRPLFGEGSPCTHYPLLIEGTIRAMKCGPVGHEILLYRLQRGESCLITFPALLDDVDFRRLDQRLASRLLSHGKPLTITHQMLADELGTTREVVSRTLESFQESGLLRLGRKRIEVLDRKALGRVYGVEAG